MAVRMWRADGAFDDQDTKTLRDAYAQGIAILGQTHRIDAVVERKFAKALFRTLRLGGFDHQSQTLDIDDLVDLSVARLLKTSTGQPEQSW